MIDDFEDYFELFSADIHNYRALRHANNGDIDGTTKMLRLAKIADDVFCEEVYIHAFQKNVQKHFTQAKEALMNDKTRLAYKEVRKARKHDQFLRAYEITEHAEEKYHNLEIKIADLYASKLEEKALQKDKAHKYKLARRLRQRARDIKNEIKRETKHLRQPNDLPLPKVLAPYRADFSNGHLLQAYDMARRGNHAAVAYQLNQIDDINPQLKIRVERYAHYRTALILRKKAVNALGIDEDFAVAETYINQSAEHLHYSRPDFDKNEISFKRNSDITRTIYKQILLETAEIDIKKPDNNSRDENI